MGRAGAILAMEMVSGVPGHALRPIASDYDGTRSWLRPACWAGVDHT